LTWACDNSLLDENPLATTNRSHRAAWARIVAGPVIEDATATLEELIVSYLSRRVHRGDLLAKTAKAYLYVFQDFACFYGARPVADLTADHVDAWLRARTRKGPISRNTDLGRLRPFLGWMVRRGYIAVDPRPDLRNLRIPRILPRYVHGAEVAALLRACPNRRATLIVLFQVQMAMRCCEVAAMRLEDVSFSERCARVTGKGGHQRLLPFDDQTWSAFTSYIRENPARGGPVIRSLRHPERAIGAFSISQITVLLMYAAGIKQDAHDGMSGHVLRHTACVDMLRKGSSVRDVQAALGHLSLATTQSYMPMVIHGLRRAMGGRYYGDPTEVGAPSATLQLALPGIEAPREDIKTLLDGLDCDFEDDPDMPQAETQRHFGARW
jgi:site-specific recombinase XerD